MNTIKESSDELNPAVPVSARKVAPRKRRSVKDYFALAIGTCGVGLFPIAPGTMGSLVGVALYLTIWSASSSALESNALNKPALLHLLTAQLVLMLVVIFAITMMGIWAATRTEQILQKKDPSVVVVDEVAGQMLALLPTLLWPPRWWNVLAAFILFRAFDIWKPYPIRRLEQLKSGLGIMADDLAAGIYAALLVSALCLVLK